MKILGNEIKPGMIIEHRDDLWSVLKTQHVKPGKGGANMTMNIKLSALEEGGTEMQSSMSLSITGRLAQFGARMIVAVNNKMFDQWATSFTELMNEQTSSKDSEEKSSNQQGNGKVAETTPVKALPLAWAAIKGIFGSK